MDVPKNGHVQVRVEESLKREIEELYSDLGLTMSEAMTLFFKQCLMRKGLPFEVRLLNADSMSSIKEVV